MFQRFVVFHMHIVKVDLDVVYIAMIIHICCKCFIWMLHMLQWLYTYVVSLYSKYFTWFRCILQQIFYLFQTFVCKHFWFDCCICFTHLLQEYVPNVSSVSVLCCSKCFLVASCKCFIWKLHMLQWLCTYIVSVCFKCFQLLQKYVASVLSGCCILYWLYTYVASIYF